VIPFTCGIGFCSNNCPAHKGGVYLLTHTHTHKTKTKRTVKIINPQNSIEKTKRGAVGGRSI